MESFLTRKTIRRNMFPLRIYETAFPLLSCCDRADFYPLASCQKQEVLKYKKHCLKKIARIQPEIFLCITQEYLNVINK